MMVLPGKRTLRASPCQKATAFTTIERWHEPMNRMLLLLTHLFKTQKDIWDMIQVGSAVLVPIVIGVGSCQIQESILKKDYVGIAVSILEKPKDDEHNALRDWAVNLLVRYSPEPFSPKAKDQLESEGLARLGHVEFSGQENFVARSLSPDRKTAALIWLTSYPLKEAVPGSNYMILSPED